ncbi:PRC-barrel domain-containing protein [Tropicimonas sp. IMCC34043]|uniref:PRC-barrel domain-containing protein n=1 Tax=Tropicimonas sp. IMCC34043 TaxID=2248760 RepID=UPI0018E52915|nr:PRC-barrel domain-containing protein [Tropicimonas sp. IMCC34043]
MKLTLKRILQTSTLAGALAIPAIGFAESTTQAPAEPARISEGAVAARMAPDFIVTPSAGTLEASDLIGTRLYVSDGDPVEVAVKDIPSKWDDVGEIGDILISGEGRVEAVLVDVGGFLGIGEKTVALPMSAIDVMHDPDGSDQFVVYPGPLQELENAPEFMPGDETAAMPAVTSTQVADDHAMDQDDGTLGLGIFNAPAPDVSTLGHTAADPADLTSENLTGAAVYDTSDERVGEIDRLVLNDQGKIESGIVDVGGFLGIGEKPVAVGFDSLTIQRDKDGPLRVYVDVSREALEQMPRYDG